jgi:hypothetical protein
MGHGLYSSFEARKCAHLRMTETVRLDCSNLISSRYAAFAAPFSASIRRASTQRK